MCLNGPTQGFYIFFDALHNSCFGCSFALRPVVKKNEDVTVGRNLNSNMTNERKASFLSGTDAALLEES